MENGIRTRETCVKFIQDRALDYFLDNPEVTRKAAKLAEELGGVLIRPNVGWKYRAAEEVSGLRNTLRLRDLYKRIRISLIKSVDKMLFEFHQQKKKES